MTFIAFSSPGVDYGLLGQLQKGLLLAASIGNLVIVACALLWVLSKHWKSRVLVIAAVLITYNVILIGAFLLVCKQYHQRELSQLKPDNRTRLNISYWQKGGIQKAAELYPNVTSLELLYQYPEDLIYLTRFKRLQKLFITQNRWHNQAQWVFPDMTKNKVDQVIDLRSSNTPKFRQLTGSDLPNFSQFKYLHFILIRADLRKANFFEQIKSLPLKTLKIQKSKLYLSELKQVFALEGLTVLSLMYTQVILDADLAIPTSSSLETLDLMGFGGDKALLYALIKAAPNLKMLDLFNAKVPDLSENELGRIRQLERLDVRKAKLSVESLAALIKASPKLYSVEQDIISEEALKKLMKRQ